MSGASSGEYGSVIFLHMPKCGGTTLNQVLDRQYRAGAIYTTDPAHPSDAILRFAAMPEASRHQFRLIRGHMPFGVHRLTRPPTAYCTILRDPVERIVSLYYYILRQPTHYLHERVVGSGMTFEEFASSDSLHALDNAMTMKFVLDPFDDRPVPGSPQECLERAKRVLEQHFAVVGLVEDFDATLVLFGRKLGWRNLYYRRRNVTADRPGQVQLSSRALDIVRERNRLDVALYEFAASRFRAELGVLGAPFARQIRLFQLVNPIGHWFGTISRSVHRT